MYCTTRITITQPFLLKYMLRVMYLWLHLFIFPCLLELKIKPEDPLSICEKNRISFISPLNYNYSIRENRNVLIFVLTVEIGYIAQTLS